MLVTLKQQKGRKSVQINKVNFPPIISDNETTYFKYIEGIISSIDLYASIQVTKRELGISMRISPSTPESFIPMLDAIKSFHSSFGIRVDFSKSMKTSTNISFNIDF